MARKGRGGDSPELKEIGLEKVGVSSGVEIDRQSRGSVVGISCGMNGCFGDGLYVSGFS